MALPLNLISTPLIYSVTAPTIPTGATFPVVKVNVATTAGGATASFDFSMPVTGGETVSIDVSSAFRAAAEDITIDPNTLTSVTTPITGVITATSEYLYQGAQQSTTIGSATSMTAYIGGWSDSERLAEVFTRSRYTRKPTSSPEIIFMGLPVVVPTANKADPAIVYTSGGYGTHQVPGANDVVVCSVEKPNNGFELRFVNGLGMFESVHVASLSTTEVAMETDRYTLAQRETLTSFSRGVAIKMNNHERWKLSSGPLNKEWAEWYAHELLMTQYAWIKTEANRYIQCHILPENTVTLVNRAAKSPYEVQFTVEFDVNGNPR